MTKKKQTKIQEKPEISQNKEDITQATSVAHKQDISGSEEGGGTEGDGSEQSLSNLKLMPLLPLKDIVVFPHMIIPVFIGENVCVDAVEDALARDKKIFLSAFKVPGVESLKHACDQSPPYDVYNVGTVCSIMRTRKLADGRMKVLVQGLYKAVLKDIVSTDKFPTVSTQSMMQVGEQDPSSSPHTSREIEAMIRAVRDNLEKIVNLGKILSPDILLIVEDVKDPLRLADLIASNLGLKVQDAQEILHSSSAFESLEAVNSYLTREIEVYQMQMKIQSQAKEEMSKMQKEHYLREQIRVLKLELGDQDPKDEIEEMWQSMDQTALSEEAREEVGRHLKRLQKMHPDSSEAVMCRTYIETVLSLPWEIRSKDNLELKRVSEVLGENHFGLKTVKERILEYLAVKKLNPSLNPPILCFVGPPGVGKTSLGQSIAKAMNRKFARISLGGVRDDAEIRGHRKTYVGAYPGRVITAIKKTGVMNPVIMLDEIDKLCSDHRGDPASTLLEILDPSQNDAFHDHYLGLSFDVSSVMFIANANTLETVPHPLKDRLEIIEVGGYTVEEKLQIARDFLVPKQLSENGLLPWNVEFSRGALQSLIQGYTKESGLRGLEKKIASVCRKQARKLAESEESRCAGGEQVQERVSDKKMKKSKQGKKSQRDQKSAVIKITPSAVEKFLGARAIIDDFYHLEPEVGVALGMAYTYFGGEILAIEVNVMAARQTKLVLTGQLGDVMKESAAAALSFLRSQQKEFGIPEGAFEKKEFHVHVPAGAVPKDGPSAGVAITTALLSALLKTPPRAKTCLTGELTLHGKVLPIGGLKEKLLAAQREGLEMAILPEKNRSTYNHLSFDNEKKIAVVFVSTYHEIFEQIFSHRLCVVEDPEAPSQLQKRPPMFDKVAS